MGTSINTAISPSIPLSRRVINDIEEHQRRVLNSYVDGVHRGMNTSPVQSSDKQEEEITTTAKEQQPVVTQVETQEETLHPESCETEDTSMKQADHIQGLDPTSVQAKNMEENEVPVAKDTNDMKVQGGNTDLQVNEGEQDSDIPEDQTSRASQEDNYQTAIINVMILEHNNIWYFLKKKQNNQKIISIIILLMEFQQTYSSQCAIHQYS